METNKEISRFRKNYQEEIVISIYSVDSDEYIVISRSFIDKDGNEKFHKYPISFHTGLIHDLITGLQKTVQYLNSDIRLFVTNNNSNKRKTFHDS